MKSKKLTDLASVLCLFPIALDFHFGIYLGFGAWDLGFPRATRPWLQR